MENPLGAPTSRRSPEGALENVFDVHWRPYGNDVEYIIKQKNETKKREREREQKHM